MSYQVTINFKSGPALGLTIFATSEAAAAVAARAEAPLYGFTDPIKSIAVRPA